MNRVRHICVIILLALFTTGSLAATAMAYCGADHDSMSMTSTLGGVAHSTMSAMEHDGMTTVGDDHSAHDGESDPSNCFECDGSLCHGQSLAPVPSTSGLYNSTIGLYFEKEINLTIVFLTRIPQPPKQLS
ncbi:MAG: hypothetical protein ACE5D4_01410 [Thermodesulfobacteriota bacterium]